MEFTASGRILFLDQSPPPITFPDLAVEIDKRLEGDDFITCVLHELVHVKQQFKGELKEMKGIEKMWKGEVYIGIDYLNLPWEKEAYHMQEVLLDEYKKDMG